MSNSDYLIASRFGKSNQTVTKYNNSGMVVAYTRVSTKEQADNNLSLDTQRRAIEDYAHRNKMTVLEYFGGTYESAKTDGRKEFMRMLDFIKKSKGKVSKVLVYTLDRFSRTGGAAIKIADELREKYGVNLFAITQPADTSIPSGALSQNIQLLFSEFDNQLRRQKVIAGMVEKFTQGIWALKPPQGYDTLRINDVRKIVVNDEGKKIRQAFQWKAEGMKNEEIVSKLKSMGVKMYKQQLHKIFTNPFYCGIISHGLLNGKVVQGKHEAMISKELFLKVNDIISVSTRSNVPHEKENENTPLKVFTKCARCKTSFSAYIVKAVGHYYYKCRTNGCGSNTRAEKIHNSFLSKLRTYSIREKMVSSMLFLLKFVYERDTKEKKDNEQTFKSQLSETAKKIDTLEEKFYLLNQVDKSTFDKFSERLQKEKAKIQAELIKCAGACSNKLSALKKAIAMAVQLPDLWKLMPIKTKELFLKLLFPEGILFDKEKGDVLINKINSVFDTIIRVSNVCDEKEKGTTPFLSGLSLWAGLRFPISNGFYLIYRKSLITAK